MRRRRLGAPAQPIVRPIFWLLLGGALVAYVAFGRKPTKRESVIEGPKLPARVTEEESLARALPVAGRQYIPDILRVAREESVSPFVIAAFMEQESLYGTLLNPPGPAGRGADGADYGLMQLNRIANASFLKERAPDGTPLWQIPYENIKRGVIGYKFFRDYFAKTPATKTLTVERGGKLNERGIPAGVYRDPRPLSGDALTRAAFAAYNAGQSAVLASIAAGKPADFLTAKGTLDGKKMGYGSLVAARLSNLIERAETA